MKIDDPRLTAVGITVRISADKTHAYLKLPNSGEVIVATDGETLNFFPARCGGQRKVYAMLGLEQ